MAETELIPSLSLAERDRRHKLVREKMAAAGLDVLLLPANTSRWEQVMADSRYVTGIGGFATEVFTVFPAKGPLTAYVFNRANWWKRVQDWVEDVRDGRNRWAEDAVSRLRELGFKDGRLGISGLSGLIRTPDGIVAHTTVEALRQAFPDVELVNATSLMQEVRAIKSAEEIGCMERSMEIIERMIEVMTEGRTGGRIREGTLRGHGPRDAAQRRRAADALLPGLGTRPEPELLRPHQPGHPARRPHRQRDRGQVRRLCGAGGAPRCCWASPTRHSAS